MAFFKTEEQRIQEIEEKIEKAEQEIWGTKIFWGKVGATHTGWNFNDGFRNADKTKFNKTKFEIHDDKILIERNRQIIQISQIEEIFRISAREYIIILNNGEGIPISTRNNSQKAAVELKAFANILEELIEENESDIGDESIEDCDEEITESEDTVDRLIELGKMYEKGLLTDEEFAAMKKKLIQ